MSKSSAFLFSLAIVIVLGGAVGSLSRILFGEYYGTLVGLPAAFCIGFFGGPLLEKALTKKTSALS